MKYIIVQAGGRGSRLKNLTDNKPKALVPIDNLPMLFHLFRRYKDKKFIIISDYKKEVMKGYLSAFAEVDYIVVEAKGTGTAGGIGEALERIPDNESFMLVWSDLVLPENFSLPEEYQYDCEAMHDYVGISKTFPCRWKYEGGEFAEESSTEYGVAGFFLFTAKAKLSKVPESGELVRWMKEEGFKFEVCSLAGTREFGLIEEYEKLAGTRCRPFNKMTVNNDRVIKEPIDEQGRGLAKREENWYSLAKKLGIEGIPKIYSTSPLEMEYIDGSTIYEKGIENTSEKKEILRKIITTLKEIHGLGSTLADRESMRVAYYTKTFDRLGKIRDLVPFAGDEFITVNKRRCRNVFSYRYLLEDRLEKLKCDSFSFIHGDCTFSNMMLRKNGEPVLIDPRGYFGTTEIYGDERYDWAKLYYSIVGNYDRFNLKKFTLEIGGGYGRPDSKLPYGEVKLNIESNGWEDMADEFFRLTGANEEEIKLIHAVIWLSLTTYAWQDYDSVCGAFYNGLYYLEEIL